MPTSEDLQHSINTRQLTMIGIGNAIGALFVDSGKEIAAAGPDIAFAYLPSGLVTILVIHMLAELSTVVPEAGPFFELRLPRTQSPGPTGFAVAHGNRFPNAQWWHTPTPSEQSAMVWVHPDLIGDADGIPYAVRARAMELWTWR